MSPMLWIEANTGVETVEGSRFGARLCDLLNLRLSREIAPERNSTRLSGTAERFATLLIVPQQYPRTDALDESIALGHSREPLVQSIFRQQRTLDLNSRGRVSAHQSGSPPRFRPHRPRPAAGNAVLRFIAGLAARAGCTGCSNGCHHRHRRHP
jgi:hypothetical protein